jgi:DNA-binding XRE family transcriptional regulator
MAVQRINEGMVDYAAGQQAMGQNRLAAGLMANVERQRIAADERIANKQLESVESGRSFEADQARQERQFMAEQGQVGREFSAEQARQDRELRSREAGEDRNLQRLSLNQQNSIAEAQLEIQRQSMSQAEDQFDRQMDSFDKMQRDATVMDLLNFGLGAYQFRTQRDYVQNQARTAQLAESRQQTMDMIESSVAGESQRLASTIADTVSSNDTAYVPNDVLRLMSSASSGNTSIAFSDLVSSNGTIPLYRQMGQAEINGLRSIMASNGENRMDVESMMYYTRLAESVSQELADRANTISSATERGRLMDASNAAAGVATALRNAFPMQATRARSFSTTTDMMQVLSQAESQDELQELISMAVNQLDSSIAGEVDGIFGLEPLQTANPTVQLNPVPLYPTTEGGE